MLLDGFLHGVVGPTHALWQKHAHAIRATPGANPGAHQDAASGASRGHNGNAAEQDPTFLAVDWVHLEVGDGKAGPPILCCPEEHPRKKHRVASAGPSPRGAAQGSKPNMRPAGNGEASTRVTKTARA